jgi:peptide/nickel transport system permease protein
VIAQEGSRKNLLAIVAEGQIAVLPPTAHSPRAPREHEEPAIVLHPGSVFGEKMLLEGESNTRTMLAATDVELLTLHREDLASIFDQQHSELTPNGPTHLLPALGETAVPLLLRGGGRLVSVAALIVALVFVVALLMELGREGDLRTLTEAAPSAAAFTADYLEGLSHGDLGTIASRFGRSRGTPVVTELARALPKSLGLLAASLLLAVPAGLYLGITAAIRKDSRLSGLLIFTSALGVSTPSYLVAMLLIWLVGWLYRTTGQRPLPIAGFGWDAHLLLPALVLAARPAAAVTRLSYNALVDILESDYVRTARSKGLKENIVLLEHVLRSAGVPILATVVVSLRFSLAILPIVEYIFSLPGIGLALLTAVQAGDIDAAIGLILPLALLFILVNVVAETLYHRLDPRLRDSQVGAL